MLRSWLADRSFMKPFTRRARPARRSQPLWLECLEDRTVPSATLVTDLPDYAPGDTATLFASGFQVGESVEFHVTSDVSGPGQDPWSVTDGSAADLDGATDGKITTTWLVDPDGAYLGATLTATATGASSGEVATATFTDHMPAPTNLAAVVVSATQVDLTWDGPSSPTGANANHDYHIERRLGTSGPFVEIATVALDGSNDYSDTLPTAGTYQYRVRYHHHPSPSAFSGYSNIVTVTTNTPPTCIDDTDSTDEDDSVTTNVTANDSDPDTSDVLSVSAASITSGLGSVSFSGGSVTYNPGTAYNYLAVGESAPVVISYTVSDGNGGSDDCELTITVNGTNDAPACMDDSNSTDEDDSVITDVAANDTDPDTSDVLSVSAASVTSGLGSVSFSGGSVTYDPGTAYNYLAVGESETVVVSYTVSDGNGGSDDCELTITVNGTNDAPTCMDDSNSTDEDDSVITDVAANDTDPDTSDVLSVSAASVTSGLGSVSFSGGSVTYDPGTAYNYLAVGESETVVVSYTVSDGNGGSDDCELTITVNGTNDAPTCVDDSATVAEGGSTTVVVVANDTDPDASDTLTVSAVTQGAHGSVSFSGGSVTYQANAGYSGGDSFSYTVSDGNGGYDTCTVTITVTPAGTGVTMQLDECVGGGAYAMVVHGTGGNDTIVVSPSGNAGALQVQINGVSQGTFTPDGRIIMFGGDGSDDLQIAGSITRSAWLYGGKGNDRMKGGNGNDLLLGGDDDDLVVGGAGRDLMIGGCGADRLVGNADDDILIAGYTAFDANEVALCGIMDEWTDSTRTFSQRVANLSNNTVTGTDGSTFGSRANAGYFLTDATVFDDNAADILTGSEGSDWFLFNSDGEGGTAKDKATDLSAKEFSTDLDWINC